MISILIPVHNQPELLERCLQGIISNTHTFEVLVYDNGSTGDGVRNVCHRYGARYFRSETNEGFIKPCNELAAHARGEYLCLMNNDVEVNGPWEQQVKAALTGNVALVGRDARMIYANGDTSRLNQPEYNYLEGSFIVMPRRVYNTYGLFDETLEFAYAEDVELCLRLQEAELEIRQLDLPIEHLRNKTRNQLPPAQRKYLQICWSNNLNKVLKTYSHMLSDRKI